MSCNPRWETKLATWVLVRRSDELNILANPLLCLRLSLLPSHAVPDHLNIPKRHSYFSFLLRFISPFSYWCHCSLHLFLSSLSVSTFQSPLIKYFSWHYHLQRYGKVHSLQLSIYTHSYSHLLLPPCTPSHSVWPHCTGINSSDLVFQ